MLHLELLELCNIAQNEPSVSGKVDIFGNDNMELFIQNKRNLPDLGSLRQMHCHYTRINQLNLIIIQRDA